MREAPDLPQEQPVLVMPRLITRRDAAAAIVVAVLSLLYSIGLCLAGILLHPPGAVIPLLVIACVGLPVLGTWQLPPAVAALRATRRESDRRAVAALRKGLRELPEIDHPLGGC